MPCVSRSRHWKASSGLISYSNIGYTNGSAENQFTFIVHVLVLPDLAAASSSHELTVRIDYPGKGSPQYFKFYINVTDHEIFTAPDRNGNLPLNIYLNEQCRSITHSSDVEFILHTHFSRQYGRLIAVLPMPTGAMGQSFKLCNFGIVFKGHNIIGRFNTTTIRGGDEMIEKVFLDISPLTNVHFATYDKLTVNFVTMKLVTYIDQSIQINESTIPFIASLISNKKTIWTGELPMTKPSIEYYQNFIVLTAIVKIPDVNPQNLWYHYSQNGTYYHKEKIVWESGRNNYVFEFPKVIAYFYFSTTPCTVVCNVTTDWLPLKYYVTFVKDDNNVLLRKLPYALDQDLNTCFDLPLPGDSPSLMWVRITELSLFGVTSQKFEISITGDGIECARVGQKSLKVGTSGPAYNDQCSINSDITFCKLVSNITIATKTRCDVKCECDTPSQCSDVHVLMQSTNNDDWRMCELTINDV
ncbi:uncharacterized protein LOC117344444 [Pecten maximus]|uniref:uncharacterized protein LOC117344444 n=1 Tax=Pecten maximus TaxID=6579 RepID=UPI0014584041|nr:uncharacterized protein LOC117344444 [Pecten maximus]